MPSVTLTQPTVYETEGVRLLPGANSITAAQLNRLMGNKHVAADFASGLLLVDKASAPANDVTALQEAARGDARRKATRDARAQLEAMGEVWQ
jgi:hypothetical protein